MKLVHITREFDPNSGFQCTTGIKAELVDVVGIRDVVRGVVGVMRQYLSGLDTDIAEALDAGSDIEDLVEVFDDYELTVELPTEDMPYGVIRDDGNGVEHQWVAVEG